MVQPLLDRLTPTGADLAIDLSDARHPTTARLEALVRPLWAVAALAAGGGRFDHWDRIREMVVAGTDPRHPHFVGVPTARDQRLVEMGVMGAALMMAPQELWEPLDARARRHLVTWLRHGETTPTRDNNWWFFRVMAQLGLRRVGVSIDDAAERRAFARIDRCARDGGWYVEQANRLLRGNVDWYAVYVFHTFGLLYAWSGLGDERRSAEFRDRAAQFAQHLQHWYAPTGEALPYGRSLTYRSAQAAFWGMLGAADVEALPWAQVKGLYLRNLRVWEPVLSDTSTLLPRGYLRPSVALTETYSTVGSPAWACLGVLGLLADAAHPLWSADEAPLAAPAGPIVQPVPGFVVSRDADQVLAVSARQHAGVHRDGDAKYGRLAYSSAFGFSLDTVGADGLLVADSTITVTHPSGATAVRRDPRAFRVTGDVIVSTWQPWPGVRVHTALTGCAPWHDRVHLVDTDVPVTVRDWGFAVDATSATVHTGADGTAWVDVVAADRRSGLIDADGSGAAGAVAGAADTNLLVEHPLVPMVERTLAPGRHLVRVRVFGAGAGALHLWERPPAERWRTLEMAVSAQARRLPGLRVWGPPSARVATFAGKVSRRLNEIRLR